MKTKLPLLTCFLSLFYSAIAQTTWSKKLPFNTLQPSFIRLSFDGERYLLGSDGDFVEIDRLGSVTGHVRRSVPIDIWTSTIKRYSASTGHPYFLIAKRSGFNDKNCALVEYRPGVGLVNEKAFVDTSVAFLGRRTQIVELNDSVFVVAGRKFFRKIKYSQSEGFTELWAKVLNLQVESAFFHNNLIVVADALGVAIALDEDGNTVWSHSYTDLKFRSIKPVNDGFIACGQNANGKAFIAKLDELGLKVWEKETADVEYRDIAAISNDYVVTGKSEAFKVMLARTDADGNELWKQEYGPGVGERVLQDPDGGVVLGARNTTPVQLVLVKTDFQGFSAPLEEAFIANRVIKTSSVRVTLEPSPSLFFNGSDATFLTIADSVATIFAFAPWLGGLDENDSIHVAAADYEGYLDSDYRSGLMNGAANDFKRVWATNKEEINRLRLDFGVDQQLDQLVPFDLLTWPARGNPNLRYNLDFFPTETTPKFFPAPFVDVNGDGIYNVYDGDFPKIKGDRMAWLVLTDSAEHEKSGGKVVGIDLLVSVFAYECFQLGAINSPLFVDFEVINRSNSNYHDTYMGFFTDFDLGCPNDDYLGTIPSENTYYVYNQDATDCNTPPSFGGDIPVQAITFLNKSLNYSMYFINASEFQGTTNPSSPLEFYQFLQGKWRDGTPLTVGGSGYNPGSADIANYIFPDNPNDPNGWTMCTANLPYADRRMIASHGAFDFNAGDTFKISLAFTLHPDIEHPCPDIFESVKPAVAQLIAWENSGALSTNIGLPPVVTLAAGQSVTLDASLPDATSYIWSTGATTPNISVSQPGNYSVTVTALTGCQIVENVLVQLKSSSLQPNGEMAWTIQPNPAKNSVSVECQPCADGTVQAVLRNAQGAVMRSLTAQNSRFNIETSDFSAGFYWLELWERERFLGIRKLILTD